MSRRTEELSRAIVRCQTRLRAAEKALVRFVEQGKAEQPSRYSEHRELLAAIAMARNDVEVLTRSLKAEAARPFDLLREKLGA
jgi:hypothetical protein